MFCPYCGNEIPDGSVFCPNCGNRIETGQSGMSGGEDSYGGNYESRGDDYGNDYGNRGDTYGGNYDDRGDDRGGSYGNRGDYYDGNHSHREKKDGPSPMLIVSIVLGVVILGLIVFVGVNMLGGKSKKDTASTEAKASSAADSTISARTVETDYDPFETVTVKFSGSDGSGTISIDKTNADERGKAMSFTADKTSGLKNGDVVKVSLSKDSQELCRNTYKVTPVVSKKFTVSGLSSAAAATTVTPIPTQTPVPTAIPAPTAPVPTAPPVQNTSGAQDPSTHDFVFADSDTRIISESEVSGLPQNWIWIAKNEIYAREGRIFSNQDLANYFESKSWYRGYITPEQWESSGGDDYYLNSVERKNAHMMAKYAN